MAESNIVELKQALATDRIQKRFAEMLGKKSAGFLSSIMNCVQNNALLQAAPINSIILAAAQAAALDLPINPNLGFAAIIPFKNKQGTVAQFQIMRDGWVELLQRTGQVVAIANEPVYEGELVKKNRFTDEYVFDESKRTSDKIVGFMAYFRLVNGFEKTVYWTVEECRAHAEHYSQTFKYGKGLWCENFSAMSLKTVLKHIIKKYAPKSIELQTAMTADNASFIGNIDNIKPQYDDNMHVTDVDTTEVDVDATEVEETPEIPRTSTDDNEQTNNANLFK